MSDLLRSPSRPLRLALALGFPLLAACAAATPNPSVKDVKPVTPAPKTQPAISAASVGPASEATESSSNQKPDPAPATKADAPLTLGSVGGQAIDARAFFARLWTRDGALAREILEQLVFARLALFEADRLGVRLAPELADASVERAYAALGKKLQDSGSRLTVDEHIAQKLQLDPAFYRRQLRSDSIVQLLAERCVRAWGLESERAMVRLIEVKDEKTLEKVRTEIAAGTPFEDLAKTFGADEDAAAGGTRLLIVRSENFELSRVAFATPVGEVGGPLTQGGRFLLIRVEERLSPETGDWATLGPKVEADLVQTPVDNLEYVQWRAAMVRRYEVDLEPFLALVGDAPP